MKLNNKGFAISTIMYMILILAVILIIATLSVLGSRKLVLDKQKSEALDNVYAADDVADSEIISSYNFSYKGKEETFIVPKTGYYKLETWGAQGGEVSYSETTYAGGYGGYSTGIVYLEENDVLYINVGGQGLKGESPTESYVGGYNGGGDSHPVTVETCFNGSGGGATHIATTSGLLSELSSQVSEILIVSGGGGGSGKLNKNSATYEYGIGGSGGGIIGVDGTHVAGGGANYAYGTGGTQEEGGTNSDTSLSGSFGAGANASLITAQWKGGAGGGGGFYGGGTGYTNSGAGGGSGYVGNELLTNKAMYCYNCSETDFTISTTETSSIPISEYAKEGDGYAKISFVGETNSVQDPEESILFTYKNAEEEYIVPKTGYYKLETWGAQGGAVSYLEKNYEGGYGGYSTGIVYLEENDVLYINVGGQGLKGESPTESYVGGYNGGGDSHPVTVGTCLNGSGGGATHIATTSGLLSELSSQVSEILIVSGGGGGSGKLNQNSATYEYGIGGSGGGIIGNDGTNVPGGGANYAYGTGGTQETGGTNSTTALLASFGTGANASLITAQWKGGAGGGGGFYGGGTGYTNSGAGGGSGYIGNEFLTNKAMYCYKCDESDNETTLTISILQAANSPLSKIAKKGNGSAKITYIGETLE